MRGKLSDSQLEIIENGGILINNDSIDAISSLAKLKTEFIDTEIEAVKSKVGTKFKLRKPARCIRF